MSRILKYLTISGFFLLSGFLLYTLEPSSAKYLDMTTCVQANLDAVDPIDVIYEQCSKKNKIEVSQEKKELVLNQFVYSFEPEVINQFKDIEKNQEKSVKWVAFLWLIVSLILPYYILSPSANKFLD